MQQASGGSTLPNTRRTDVCETEPRAPKSASWRARLKTLRWTREKEYED
jgi:hypothetical protein